MQDIYEEIGETRLEDYELVYTICDHPDSTCSAHFHSVIELFYVLEGAFVVTVNDMEYTLQPGEMVVINSKDVHSTGALTPGINRSFALKFYPETICSDSQSIMELKFILPCILSFSDFKTYYTRDEIEKSNIKNCLESIMNADRNREYAYKFAIRVYISMIVLELISKVNKINPLNDEIKPDIQAKFTDIFQYISRHYAEKISSVQLAKMFGFRQMDFSAYFKKITGKSFNEYLNYTRICKAKRLLIYSDKNISEIAYEVGYSHQTLFTNSFKKQMGITPMSFRHVYADPPANVCYNLKENKPEI